MLAPSPPNVGAGSAAGTPGRPSILLRFLCSGGLASIESDSLDATGAQHLVPAPSQRPPSPPSDRSNCRQTMASMSRTGQANDRSKERGRSTSRHDVRPTQNEYGNNPGTPFRSLVTGPPSLLGRLFCGGKNWQEEEDVYLEEESKEGGWSSQFVPAPFERPPSPPRFQEHERALPLPGRLETPRKESAPASASIPEYYERPLPPPPPKNCLGHYQVDTTPRVAAELKTQSVETFAIPISTAEFAGRFPGTTHSYHIGLTPPALLSSQPLNLEHNPLSLPTSREAPLSDSASRGFGFSPAQATAPAQIPIAVEVVSNAEREQSLEPFPPLDCQSRPGHFNRFCAGPRVAHPPAVIEQPRQSTINHASCAMQVATPLRTQEVPARVEMSPLGLPLASAPRSHVQLMDVSPISPAPSLITQANVQSYSALPPAMNRVPSQTVTTERHPITPNANSRGVLQLTGEGYTFPAAVRTPSLDQRRSSMDSFWRTPSPQPMSRAAQARGIRCVSPQPLISPTPPQPIPFDIPVLPAVGSRSLSPMRDSNNTYEVGYYYSSSARKPPVIPADNFGFEASAPRRSASRDGRMLPPAPGFGTPTVGGRMTSQTAEGPIVGPSPAQFCASSGSRCESPFPTNHVVQWRNAYADEHAFENLGLREDEGGTFDKVQATSVYFPPFPNTVSTRRSILSPSPSLRWSIGSAPGRNLVNASPVGTPRWSVGYRMLEPSEPINNGRGSGTVPAFFMDAAVKAVAAHTNSVVNGSACYVPNIDLDNPFVSQAFAQISSGTEAFHGLAGSNNCDLHAGLI